MVLSRWALEYIIIDADKLSDKEKCVLRLPDGIVLNNIPVVPFTSDPAWYSVS